MSIFEQDFDMKEYIAQRALEIEDLESRKRFKAVTTDLFEHLYEEVEARYNGLEQRVLSEVPIPVEAPEFITGIVTRSNYDVTDEFMRPVRESDVEEKTIAMKDIAAALKAEQPFLLKMIFLAADYTTVRRFADTEQVFSGLIHTTHGQIAAKFKVRQNLWYQQQVENFNLVFQKNYLPWRTVCMPYFRKLFDVYLVEANELDAEESITSIVIDFGAFQPMIREDQVPLWNIGRSELKTSAYPEPCVDKTNYDHCIYRHLFLPDRRYILAAGNVYIENIRWQAGDLLITCPVDEPVKWDMYCFYEDKRQHAYENPLMSNGVKDNFAHRLQGVHSRRIRTLTEIRRILASFKLDWLEFQGVKIRPNGFRKETYMADAFLKDEIRSGTWTEVMQFDFTAKQPDHYLNIDVLSFLTGVLQECFPDYECCGHLV